MMIKNTFIYRFHVIIWMLLINNVLSQNMVFPDSSEDSNSIESIQRKFQISMPGSRGTGVRKQGIRTVSVSSRMFPVDDAMGHSVLSGSQANAGSSSFNYGGGGGSGSSASANSGSFNYGSPFGTPTSGSGSSAQSGSLSFNNPSMYGSSMSGSSAQSGSMSYGGGGSGGLSGSGSSSGANSGSLGYYPGTYGGGSGSSSSAQSNAMSLFQPGFMNSIGGSGSSANAGSLNYVAPPYGSPYGNSGSSSFASSGSSSFSNIPCSGKPKSVGNSRLSCTAFACQISCLDGYKFPTGETTMSYVCNNGQWIVKSLEFNEVPACEPICNPKCLNNGICVSPGECECPENFMGPTCEVAKKLCIAPPPLPKNAKRSCTPSKCTVTCMGGFKFPDKTLSMNLACIGGVWKPERADLMTTPDCEPFCDPPCQNGGNCVGFNMCQCSQKFRGPQCQYSIDRCSPKKLNFNGEYKCKGTSDYLSCTLTCLAIAKFSFPPASEYICYYSVGKFAPEAIPKCLYGEGVVVVPGGESEHYSVINGTLSKNQGRKNKSMIIGAGGDEEEEEEIIEETISTVIKKRKKKKNETLLWVDEDEFFEAPNVYQFYSLSQGASVTYQTPKPSVCITWNGNKIKTFDGVTYSHELICTHVLVQDFIDGTFNVFLRSCPYDSTQPCPHALEVFIQNEQFTFENVGGSGQVKMFTTKKEIPIPVQIAGLKVTRSGMDVRIVLEAIPLTITWDTNKFVQIDAVESIFNRTAGICGTMDGIPNNDFMSKDGKYHKMPATFVDSWRAVNMDNNKEKCIPRSLPIKSGKICETAVEEKANLVCVDLLKNPKMKNCLSMFNEKALMENCISDYCECKNTYERTECICNGITALAKDCRFKGVLLEDGWRDWQICPLNCTNGRIYKSCGPINEPSCGSAIESDSFNCREGCFCPDGTMLNDGVCVKQELCPCKLKGKAFSPSTKIKKDCNTCTCENGNWKCTSLTCGARCGSVGDPHYVTFDGKRYDFMGKCSYYLMKTDTISVEAENVACSGAISESMNFLPSFTTELPSCTKSLTIKFNDDAGQQRIIKLKQGRFVLLDGFEVSKLPRELSNGAIQIRQASSSFIVVDFQDGVKVWWDGSTRAYIDAPASYRGKTLGLCGTFNSNMQDDFLTPEGDIETTIAQFANKWQTKDSCEYLTDKIVPHPCQVNPHNKAKAEKICSKIMNDRIFEECHLFVDPQPFYEDCLYDMCACDGDISQCSCPIFAAYATECARQGTILNWRYQVSECAINCPYGQVFEQCGEACTRTCSDLQSSTPCKLQCVEGCRCPLGQVLDEEINECVMISMCKCFYKGMEFNAGYKEVRPGVRYLELCTCNGGQWNCVEAKDGDSIKFPPATDLTGKCSPSNNEVFTTCEPAEPVTCKNMHLNVETSTAICRAGCKCKDGYVLDVILKKCVLPEKCSCHHGGRSYNEAEKIKEDCNTCICREGKWQCTTKECPGTCSLWGDNHFKSFDGREFDFQGVCSYVLSKGKFDNADGYSVSIQNVLCGSNGVTCSKTLIINLIGNEPESITLSSDFSTTPGIKTLSNAKPLKKILTYRSGVFLVVEIPHIGVLLKWDRGTRVYLRLENHWKGKVQGLCGNYNYDALDDFLNPSLGIENNPIIFGHSWKLDDSCAIPTEQVDSCTLNPQRKTWAQRKCGLLKSSEFSLCHSEVPVDSFYKRCIHDACSCDQGGDCECLCTALAAYAYECTAKGVNIRWRTPDLCPMQCDPECSNYNACIESCPVETCDNMMHPLKHERLCKSEMCVEGCKLKECPEGMVYSNETYKECVPKATCKPICLHVNGITYYEGDIITSDACHTCKCSRGSKVCTGIPCTPIVPPGPPGDIIGCETGMTAWINQDTIEASLKNAASSNYFKENDIEPLPSSLQFRNMGAKIQCSPEFYASIECRTVIGHLKSKDTNQNVECSLERGLICNGQCFDYEIRLFCDCGDQQRNFSTPAPIIQSTITIPTIPVIQPTTPKYSINQHCDPAIPNVEHPKSCSMFLQCERGIDGNFVYVEKNCGPGTMYNPKIMVCDLPFNVIPIKPQCGKPEEEMSGDQCPPGYVFSDCAIPCKRSCHYYDKVLTINGNCTHGSDECKSGCLPTGAVTSCPFPKLYRDHSSCVESSDCTCMGPNNEQLKPGQKIATTDCKTCQCINNELICIDTVPCRIESTPAPIIPITPKPSSWPPVITTKSSLRKVTISCDLSVPFEEHPRSCYKYLVCKKDIFGKIVNTEENCYPDKMYNPSLKKCDSIQTVVMIKPNCAVDPGETDFGTEDIKNHTRFYISSTPSYIITPPSYISLCDLSLEYKEHPNSCYKFLHCSPATNGSYIYVVKTCYPNMMYNHQIKNCDWPNSVKAIKPSCESNPGEIDIWEYTTPPIVKSTTPKYIPGPTPPIYIPEPPYYIKACDPTIPKTEHPENCHNYLECQRAPNGNYVYVEKSCGISLMYNPNYGFCDAIDEVTLIKPFCRTKPIFPEIENQLTSSSVTPPSGRVTTRKPQKVTTTPSTVITKTTMTPPHYCSPSNMVPLLHYLPDSAFTASSFLSKAFKPEAARLDSRPGDGSMGNWSPLQNDLNQYLQIEFPQPIPVYSVIVRGSPILSQYVTSYKVLYSYNDGIFFHVIEDENGNPQIFGGSIDSNKPVKNIFKTPVEAKFVRIYPLSWEGSIALRLEILGCQKDPGKPPIILPPVGPTTPISIITPSTLSTVIVPTFGITPSSMFTITPPIKPLCDDPMGVENSELSPNQIKFSSIKDMGSVKSKVKKNPLEIIKLSSIRGWMPLADSVNEYILIDFLENRNLTGMATKGGEYGWVKSYTISHSKDDVIWNKIQDYDTGKPRQFLANVDSESVKKIYFQTPINARYVKIQPTKWRSAIELKLEPIGCYKPYPFDILPSTIAESEEVDVVTPTACGLCKGVLPPPTLQGTCYCNPSFYWSGNECVPQHECPCVEGHQTFPVGEIYKTENCDECTCQLGGIPKCKSKQCPPCQKGLRRIAPGTCDCKCEKCPPTTVLCQTNGQCVSESSWCDGVDDCPDDEINCGSKVTPVIHTNKTETIEITKKCPTPECPPGYLIKEKPKRKPKMSSRFNDDDDDENDKPTVNSYYYIKAKYTASYEAILPISMTGDREDINSEDCIEFMCLPTFEATDSPDYAEMSTEKPIKCPEPKCPKGYMMKLQLIKSANQCAKFTCEALQENDVVCNVTGKTFNTFDSTEFKYDICSHLLARDIADEKWNVIMRKNCTGGNNVCIKEVEIKDKVSLYTLILYPTLTVNLDGYFYTVNQLQNSNRKMSFVVSKNGDSLLYVSNTHGIWLTFDQFGDVKLGISSQYAKQVDGLCGYFNNDKFDDKRMPNGEQATSNVEFGNSWSLNQLTPEECEPQVCPQKLQEAALKMCDLVKEDIFSSCAVAVNTHQFVSSCLDSACDCLLASTNGSTTNLDPREFEKHTKECKCAMLKNYVQECMAADENIHLETWRSVFSCEATCPTPFVHQDCYRRRCEITCNNLQSAECPNVPGTCFSGCFCPPGSVKKESSCVPISECRDCVCDGFGKSQYLTYDRKNFTFDGNCTYLLTRDIALKNVHTFQAFATIGPCDNKIISFRQPTCTHALHIVYGSHIVHIQKNALKNLEVIVDGLKLPSLSYNQNWMKITQQGKSLNILLPESQVELVTMFEAMSFSIKVPSVKFGNKMEGICGNCNGNPDDDLIKNPNITFTLPPSNTEMQNFALSWLADEPKLSLNENKAMCHVDEETDCLPLPPETDPCFKILDDEAFAKCHIIVDPISYVTACQQDLCRTGPTQKGSCESIAAYARECLRNGICIDWRRNGFCPMDCAAPFVYNPCGCGETCQSVEEKQKQIKLSTAIKDARTIDKMKSICKAGLSEGCFCPNATVLHNGKCLREIECRACDDKGHLPGDVWHLDVCTKCTCSNDSTIQCQKIQCPTQQICGIGFVAIESSPTGECCKKYACVPEVKPTSKCPQLVLPKCGLDQTNKLINDTNNCSKYICDCVPKAQCKPMQNFTKLEPGQKTVIDTTGCCPTSKLICDKSTCPPKPPQCTEAFYSVEKIQTATDKICCDIFECRPPPKNCIATINGKKILKKMDELWMTEDVCVKAQCAFDTNGNPVIKTQREECNVICQAGFEYKSISNKCCGECVKTKCIADNKLYEIGENWYSDDNCTTFVCNIQDGQILITSEKPTCPDISSCLPQNRYNDGCCEKCKLESLSQKNCVAESLAETQTIGLIQVQMPPHGNCKNLNGVRGITHCSGTCKSGTKFDPLTFHQIKECDCCSVSQTRELPVELICDNGYKFIKNVDVPSDCECSACENAADSILKLARASF